MSKLHRTAPHRPRWSKIGPALATAIACVLGTVAARADDVLPSPLDSHAVVRLAKQRRAEMTAAHARAAAAAQRPRIVSALPDPVFLVTAERLPGTTGSITLQQEFPLSDVLGNRRRAAEAEAARYGADTERVGLDVEREALDAFFELAQRRETAPILDEQIAITEQLALIARAHLASGQGTLSEALRLDNEIARFRADRAALDAEIRGAEAMLNTTLARDASAPVSALVWTDDLSDPPTLDALARKSLGDRPELASARAERRRALSEVEAMRSLYAPVAVVRAGPSYMTADGPGVLVMVGISVPIWRDRLAAGVSEARSMAAGASAEISAMERTIVGRVAVDREHVIAERTRLLAIRQDILPRARMVVSSATGSFAAGQAAMLPVLDASRDLRDVRMQELMARARLSTAWANLWRETAGFEGTLP